MAAKRAIRTSRAVPKRSVLYNNPVDYDADSARLVSELEKFLPTSGKGGAEVTVSGPSDVSKVLKGFSRPRSA
jgi:hypothetical protein